ncbi:MAG: indole-3-glycerol phosphate synthase TrpC [Ignavibacteriae bacterium HGW-Ignavibacteriae-2]|jgi:indole-3-glycerol phosphate synthase|nr:MAG: indole-3-glycerol phosphate synthase TrpC [Ignavibacteriae bacterium HGW-Ignavibacteriae-2]
MNILNDIIEVKKEEVKYLRRNYSLTRFSDNEFFLKDRIPFYTNLNNLAEIAIIAEIKKASPSKGIIRTDFNHLKIADIYLNNEVNAISILTDKTFFQGSISYLNDIAMIKTVPLLRKDFIIDEYQVYEAKANGADIILLITEALSSQQIKELTEAAFENDLEVLLELHSSDQIDKIDFSLNKIIGINNRNLDSFIVDLNSTINLSALIPSETILISESGITKREDIELIKQANTKAVLVGEHFMKSTSIEDSVKQMKEWCRNEN